MSVVEPRHPINYVSQRTGLSTHVIRVWERRYGAVAPVRTPTNRRLYSDADIERLRLLKAVTSSGHSIGHIANLPDEELRRLADASGAGGRRSTPTQPEATHKSVGATTPAEFLEQSKGMVRAMDGRALSSLLVEASISLNQFSLLEDFIAPLLVWVGDEWHDGKLRVAHEHVASSTVRSFLGTFRSRSGISEQAPVILIATPSGHHHELGALLAANVAALEGWHEIYFGANLPVQEIVNAARESKARGVGLSIAYVGDAGTFLRELETLRHYLPETVDLIVGGAGAAPHGEELQSMGIWSCDSLSDFRDVLGQLSGRTGQGNGHTPGPKTNGNESDSNGLGRQN